MNGTDKTSDMDRKVPVTWESKDGTTISYMVPLLLVPRTRIRETLDRLVADGVADLVCESTSS